MTTAPLLHSGDKDLEEIQQIIRSTKVANMVKRSTSQNADLAIRTKRKATDSRQQPKSRSTKECFNCGKRGHYAKDCRTSLKRQPDDEKAVEEAKQTWWTRNRAVKKVATARSTDQDESDLKLYSTGRAFMIKQPNPRFELIDTWYLDSCASRHICKNRDLFSDLQPKNFEFITVGGEFIWSQKVGTVHLSFQSGKMTLLNVTYTPKCDFNLILLGQLCESGILYHDILTPWFSNKEVAKLDWQWSIKIFLFLRPSLRKQCLCESEADPHIYFASTHKLGSGTAGLAMQAMRE